MSIIDASVIIHLLIGTEPDLYTRAGELLAGDEEPTGPTLLFTEVMGRISGLTKATGPQRLSASTAQAMVEDFLNLSIRFVGPSPAEDAQRLLELGANLSIPDATYVLLGDRLGMPVYTYDLRMISGAAKLGLGDLVREP